LAEIAGRDEFDHDRARAPSEEMVALEEMRGMDAGITKSEKRDVLRINDGPLEDRLELGEVHVLASPLPFALPSAEDQSFLRAQELHLAKEIVFDGRTEVVTGFRAHSADQGERLRRIFVECHRQSALWLANALPRYAASARPIRTSFHVAEEATRCLRVSARHDLLHVDALRDSGGARLLRLIINLNPTDPRIWAASETLAKILPELGVQSGLVEPTPNQWPRRFGRDVLRLFRDRPATDPYDDFMFAFARYLKHSDNFQEKAPRKIWRFAPGQAWAAFTDGLVHADLRGRWVLDHLFLIPPQSCARPERAPAALLANLRASRMPVAA
jgi:hypothetical protein